MKIINSYRGSSLPAPNVFIGGVGATSVTSAADFASISTATVGNISNFQIDANNNVSFYTNTNYALDTGAFQGDSDITSYIDTEHCTVITNNTFRSASNLKMVELFVATGCGTDNFIDSANLHHLYIPLMTPIGASGSTSSGNFSTSQFDDLNVYSHVDNETINGGAPDPDFATATHIAYIGYIDDTTEPDSIDDLAVDAVYGAVLDISWTAPSSTNTINDYLIFVNGFYVGYTTSLSYAIAGLSVNTSYDITVKTIDEFGNRSVSNEVTQTTNASYGFDIADIVSIWQMESDSTDGVGSNDGTDTSISYVAGLVGNCADFTASTSSNISVADDASLSFGNSTTDTPLSFSMAVKYNSVTNSIYINKQDGTTREYQIGLVGTSNILRFRLYDDIASNNIQADYSWTPSTNTWYHITATYNGSGLNTGLKIYVNGVDVTSSRSTTGTYTAMSNTTQPLTSGKYAPDTSFSLNGYLDEIAIWDVELSASEVYELALTQLAGIDIIP